MRTQAEQRQREALAWSGMQTVFSWAASTKGWSLNAKQSRRVMVELAAKLAALDATEPTEALEGAVIGATVDALFKALGRKTPGAFPRGLELTLLGSAVAQRLLVGGQYPRPREQLLVRIARAVSLRAGALAELPTPIAEAREDMRFSVARTVVAVLGEPPHKPVMN